ncbi:hypothetical protein ABID58_005749 [Bradyrhizobium sp. S3.2.6]|uniref:hypothetical protein n=1 Tax=Bradyrhizobium sp. S3.2.6 TaxID=3156428 RepID=UPI00339B6B2F
MTLPPALPGDFVFGPVSSNWSLCRFPVILPEIYFGAAVSTKSQRKATRTHRRRAAARGLVRVEVQAAKKDASLIRALAETLRDKPERAAALRSMLASALLNPEVRTAFDVFGSELPDDAFEGVFDQPRRDGWREVDL